MKNKIILYLLCGLCAMSLFLSACGKKEQEDISEDVISEEENNLPEESETESETETEQAPELELQEAQTDTHEGLHPIHIKAGASYDQYWSETYKEVMASMTYPAIALEECCEAKYPELAQALTNLSNTRKADITAEYENMIEQASIQMTEMGGDYFQPYETSEIASMRRADSKVVSILMECYFYGGGVHGSPYYGGRTYDVQTGQELSLTDVVNDTDKLAQYTQNELNKYYPPETFYEGMNLNDYFAEYFDMISWVLDYTGLTIIFNPYDIAPYASGTQIVSLSFAEYPDLVKSEYQQTPESYVADMTVGDFYYYDVDGDGLKDSISVSGVMDEYNDRYIKHCIIVDGRRFEVETDSYVIDPRLVHMKNGQTYLYVQDSTDNDYRYTSIYRFTSDGAVEFVTILYNTGWRGEYIEEGYMWLEQVFTDPDQFELEGRTDVLSTVTGYKHYHVSENGVPVSENPWYILTSNFELKLLQDLEVDVIDDATGVKTGTTTLQAGTRVMYYRTDDQSFADLKLSDGSVVRVMVDSSDWPRTVSGMDIESVFEGMMFAG